MKRANTWKLQDAKARFSEVVRQARAGAPQTVTLRGKNVVVISDSDRFDVRPKAKAAGTMAEFVEASKQYRGLFKGIKLNRRLGMKMHDTRPDIFDADYSEEE